MRPQNFWNKKIPTLVGLLFIIVGIGVTSYLNVIGINPFGHAAPSETPQGIRITNISDTSFTVTYTTDEAVVGSVATGTTAALGQVFLDDRDQAQGVPNPYYTHSITVRNVNPKTTYYFSISSGTTTYLNNGSPFTLTTAPIISAQPSEDIPLAGRIIFPEGRNEALVYITANNGQTLSTLVKPSGLYVLPLNTMRVKDLTAPLDLGAIPLQILIKDNISQSRIAIQSDRRNPVPTITLGNDYDFSLGQTPIASNSATFNGFPQFGLDTTIVATPQILVPKKNENFTDNQPLLEGKAQPNTTVEITIHSDAVINTTVVADSNGIWKYRPTSPLAPGEHTITILTKDASGIIHQIQQTFTVYAQGSQVNQTATPSATLAPTVTVAPTKAPTATPVQALTNTPIPSLSPSIAPTLAPTTQLGNTTITPKPTLPPTGSSDALVAGIAGITTTALGVVLFLLTRGASL